MPRAIRSLGLALFSLTVATVALAQLGGNGASGAPTGPELRRADGGQARLTRAVERREAGPGCASQTCAEPPATPQRAVRIVRYNAGCSGDEIVSYRDHDGRFIRTACMAP